MVKLAIHARLKLWCQKWRAGSTPAPSTNVKVSVTMGKFQRGIGVCRYRECEDFNKSLFLINHGNYFSCPRCHKVGIYRIEQGTTLNNTSLDFYQVRVEFSYDPDRDRFRAVAVVTDESMDKSKGNVYTLKSPLISTEKRALEVATSLLGNLMHATEEIFDGSGVSRPKEHLLYLDKPRELFNVELAMLEQKLENSRLRKK